MATEVEVGGIKFRGGKIFLLLTALTTAGGALWGGFEFYKDYLNMKEQIQEYVAPDLSGCLLYTSPSPRDRQKSRMPSSA